MAILDCSANHAYALTRDGLLWRWAATPGTKGLSGHATLPRPVARESGSGDTMRFSSISCGADMTLAVTPKGAVVRIGAEADGVPPPRRALVGDRVRQANHLANGQENDDDDDDDNSEWLDDDDEALQNRSTAAVEGGVGRLLVALPVPLPTAVRIAQVSCGDAHRLLLSVGGTVYAFGLGSHGRLGVGGERSHGAPQCVTALAAARVVSIGAGAYHSAAVLADGSVATWGHGKYGQLGHGVQQPEHLPRAVAALANRRCVQVAASSMFTAVLTVDGDVFTMGFPMTPPEDAFKYGAELLSCSPRLALAAQHITQISTGPHGQVRRCCVSSQECFFIQSLCVFVCSCSPLKV